MFKSTPVFLMAMVGSASAADSFNVKLRFLREGMTLVDLRAIGVYVPATDDKLGSTCDPFDPLSCINLQCHQYDRSLDVFSDSIVFAGLEDVSIDTVAPYAVYLYSDSSQLTLEVGDAEISNSVSYCTGYNGLQDARCAQLPNVPDAFERNFWNGGANPGAGSTGWGRCKKCSTCYVSADFYGTSDCDIFCDGWDGLTSIQSAGPNAKNGAVVGLLGLALTSLSLFVGA